MKKRYNKQIKELLIIKALKLFINSPYEEVYLREFARKTGISLNSSQRFLQLFLKNGFINEERKANLRYFKANLENIVFRQIKIAYSLNELANSGLIDFLKKDFNQVILFGSLAKGLDDIKSDIDIVGIGIKKKSMLSEFESKLKREINVHAFTLSDWKKNKQENPAFYQDVISHGIALIGDIPII